MFRANLSHNGPKPEQGRLGTVNASQKPPMFANPCAKDDQPMRPTGPGRPVLAELAWRRHSQVPSWQLRQHEECCAFRGKDPRLFQCFAILVFTSQVFSGCRILLQSWLVLKSWSVHSLESQCLNPLNVFMPVGGLSAHRCMQCMQSAYWQRAIGVSAHRLVQSAIGVSVCRCKPNSGRYVRTLCNIDKPYINEPASVVS